MIASGFDQLKDVSTALSGLVTKAAPTIVSVRSHRSRSSGIVWRPKLIVTADEGLSEEGELTVTVSGGNSVAAKLVGRDPTTDIAVLRIEHSGLQPAGLAASSLTVGALVMAVGAEDGSPTAALGVVSRAAGPWRSMRGGEIDARIELDLRLRRSAEGGLALDAAGRAVGMTVFGPRRRVLIIPAATIDRVAAALESHGRIARGYLGLGLQQVAIDGGRGVGVMVMSVDPQGPGATAGIHQGDILVTWNGGPIGHVQSLLRALGPDSVGQTVTVELRRAAATCQSALTIAERPAN